MYDTIYGGMVNLMICGVVVGAASIAAQTADGERKKARNARSKPDRVHSVRGRRVDRPHPSSRRQRVMI